jgi:hypothetical protein
MNIIKYIRALNLLNLYNLTRINAYLPPIGSRYSTNFKVPYFGNQNIDIYNTDNTKSNIKLYGIVNMEGWVYYTPYVNENTQNLEYKYSIDNLTKQTLKKYNCKIIDAKYIKDTDICQVIITNYLISYTKTITLKRIN